MGGEIAEGVAVLDLMGRSMLLPEALNSLLEHNPEFRFYEVLDACSISMFIIYVSLLILILGHIKV